MTADAPRTEGGGRVVAVTLTLLLVLGALTWVGRSLFVAPVDGAAKQREYFGEHALPFGLALESAARLPTGDVLVRFVGPADGPGPDEVLFVEYLGRSAVEPLFRPADGTEADAQARLAEWEKERAFAWSFNRVRGEIGWSEESTRYQIDRTFAKGGTWHEQVRVDLSSEERSLVLFARWPAEVVVEVAALRALLSAVERTSEG